MTFITPAAISGTLSNSSSLPVDLSGFDEIEAGSYDVWWRVTSDPEVPARFAGKIKVR